MASIHLFSNIDEQYAKFKERANKVPDMIDKAVALNASIAMKSTIFHIDQLVYEQPNSGDYSRTKNLRRSNKLKKLEFATWLLYNDADYAGYVHNGTSQMEARPWMATAIKMTTPTMSKNLEELGMKIMDGGSVPAADAITGDSQGSSSGDSGGGLSG